MGTTWRWMTGGGLAVAAVILSLAISLRPEPFRDPKTVMPVAQQGASAGPAAPSAVSPPAVSPPAESPPVAQPAPSVASKVERGPGGPAIITIDPSKKTAAPGVLVLRDPMRMQSDPRTAHLPDPDLIEKTPLGPLPKRGPDGLRPMDVYARPWSGARGPRVAIVIGGLGLSQTGTQAAIAALPGEVTLAFSPQGNSLQRWMQAARQTGHEILMQIPLEPFGYPQLNPGRDTLLAGDEPAANLDRLHRSMARITNYTGVLNYMGARFTADAAAMEPVMADLAARGLLYLDDGSSARSVADKVARDEGTPFAAADLVIDARQDKGEILKKLDELERIARANGSAIGDGSAFDVTIDAVDTWIKEAKLRGIEIVPVSALVRDPEKQ